ncbi:hypothetical protein [Paracoccus sp. SCSIO 75233]|uniref:hypothetical protein n=1 Tax=Paracoccus sp. SCSIO 75233 TaxID=3017782 RepID=UPI0022F0B5C3|nr:hypothetical protein [Paracoccus sp. SCSIO 75233]WBU53123.1 hypothetical protein PAF12_15100 [Paracoccus sp. SCSIO 75233]
MRLYLIALTSVFAITACATTEQQASLENLNETLSTANQTAANIRSLKVLTDF